MTLPTLPPAAARAGILLRQTAGIALIASAMSLVACSTTATPVGTVAGVSTEEIDFLTYIYQVLELDIEEAEFTRTNAARADVRELASNLDDDATRLKPQLLKLMAERGLEPPDRLPYEYRIKVFGLQYGPTPDLDTAFVHDQIQSHQNVINAFEHQAQVADNPQIRDFARTMADSGHRYLARLRAIETQLEAPAKP